VKKYRIIAKMDEYTCNYCRAQHGKIIGTEELDQLPPHKNCLHGCIAVDECYLEIIVWLYENRKGIAKILSMLEEMEK
jgi:hypothetical protein